MRPRKAHKTALPTLSKTLLGLSLVVLVFMVVLKYMGKTPQNITTGPYNLDYPRNFGSRYTLPKENPLTAEGVALGRLLFYETKMSRNGQISCATCHRQELAFTDGRTFSIGVDGTPTSRNSMSLGNLLWVRNLFWDGRAKSLETQAIVPMTDPHEMGQTLEVTSKKLQATLLYPPIFELVFGSENITGARIAKALAQFERTLITDDSPYDQYLRGVYEPTPQELRGMQLFMNAPDPDQGIRGGNCFQCHGGPKTYLELFHNNGLDSIPNDLARERITGFKTDRGRFRVPTLRNIALTAPYMHDGRFQNLEEVLDHYNSGIMESETLSPVLRNATNNPSQNDLGLTKEEMRDIIAFLYMLTDSTFLTNPKFSNPHIQ